MVKREHITKIKSSDNFVLASLLGLYLSLDDVEEEVWVAAATEEVSQTERLVQALHLLLHLGRRPPRRTPEHKENQSQDEDDEIKFLKVCVKEPQFQSFLLLRVQAGKLRQQQAVALSDGLFGGGCGQVALERQDLLFLSLGDLQLPVDHLSLCVLVGNGARRVGVVTADTLKERCCLWSGMSVFKLLNCKATYFVMTISMSIFRVG